MKGMFRSISAFANNIRPIFDPLPTTATTEIPLVSNPNRLELVTSSLPIAPFQIENIKKGGPNSVHPFLK